MNKAVGYCGMEFSSQWNLDTHIRFHYNLNNHLLIHKEDIRDRETTEALREAAKLKAEKDVKVRIRGELVLWKK